MNVAEWLERHKKTLESGNEVRFDVHIKPRGHSNTIKDVLLDGETLKVSVTAPPIDNKANKALIILLADQFNIAKSRISIVKGLKSSVKTVSIT